jgi:pimeloyl-ACP methyl ester carboxylesterase
MPTLRVNGVELYYEEEGTGPEAVVFAHGLLWSVRLYDAQVAALRDRYRCIRFDFRGQGRSEVAPSGYDMDTLTEDAAALIEALRAGPCHFVGLSMGGFVGIRLAARWPGLVRTLALLDATVDAEPGGSAVRYKLMAWVGRWVSVRLVLGGAMNVLFGRKFLGDPARAAEREQFRRAALGANAAGLYRAVYGVVTRKAVLAEVGKVSAPTLVLVGEDDVATPPERARRLHELIPHSRLVVIPGAGHSPPVEEPAAVNAALAAFLTEGMGKRE